LSPAQVGRVLADLGYEGEEKEQVIAILDFDGDGTVSREEFCTNMSQTDAENAFFVRLSRYLETRQLSVEESAQEKDTADTLANKVHELETTEEVDGLVQAAGDTPLVLMFHASWCRKCVALKSKYASLAKGYHERVVFAKMNIDVQGAKERMRLKTIPSFQVFKSGDMVDQYAAGKSIPGVPKDLARLIDLHLADGFSLVESLASMDFADIDADGSGEISQDEFSQVFAQKGFSQEKIAQAFAQLDGNGDGNISRAEFEIFCAQVKDSSSSPTHTQAPGSSSSSIVRAAVDTLRTSP